jgi:outer membrane protein assembly factor BamB
MRGKRQVLVALVAAAGLVAGAGPALASGVGGDWTQADHDASGNRANTTATQLTAANVRTVSWLRGFAAPAFPPDNPGECAQTWTAPVVVAKKAYAVASGRLTVLDLTTGAQVWQRTIDATGESQSAVYAVDSGRIFVGQISCLSQSDPLGFVRAYDATTGAPLWTQEVDGLVGVAVSGNRVLGAGSSAGAGDTVRVLDAGTGAPVWQRLNADTCGVSARIVLNQVYYQECSGVNPVALVAARLNTGAVAWRKASDDVGIERGDHVGADATHLFTRALGGNITALDPTDGFARYGVVGMTRVDAVGTNRIFGACDGGPGDAGVVCAVNKATSARAWTSTIPASFAEGTAATVAATLLYLPSGQVINSGTGATIASLWSGQHSALTVADGYVLTVSADNPRVLDVYGLPGT